MAELAAGSTFAGHTIEGVAGRGGMGIVYRARQLRPERTVALKVIAPELSQDRDFRARFERESQIAASIDNPHAIPLFQAGEENGQLYISMRFVRGSDLGEVIRREGRVDPQRAGRILDQVAYALDTAHAKGLVHRDIKPGNIMIESNGREHAYLTDFGLTKQIGSRSGMTATGMFVGTIDYMPPEQFEGRDLDARADVYALGCVLYEMLTGSIPFPADSEPAKMFAHMSSDPPSVREQAPELPAELDEVVRRALAKRPADRYPSAGDLARAAMAAAEGRSQVAAPERSVAVGEAAPGSSPAEPAGTVAPPAAAAAAGPGETRAAGPGETRAAAPGETRAAGPGETALAGAPSPPGAQAPAQPWPPGAPAQRRRGGLPVALIIGGIVLLVALGVGAFLVLSGGGGMTHDQYQQRLTSVFEPLQSPDSSWNEALGEADTPEKLAVALQQSLAAHENALGNLRAAEPPSEVEGQHERLVAIESALIDDIRAAKATAETGDVAAFDEYNGSISEWNGAQREIRPQLADQGYTLPRPVRVVR